MHTRSVKVLLTGGSGFIGKALAESLLKKDYGLVVATRDVRIAPCTDIEMIVYRDLQSLEQIVTPAMAIDVVIHTAARVHVMDETSQNPIQAFREVNVVGTLNFARQAADSGVKRFIFVSSIKVNGESTKPGECFVEEDDGYIPSDPYGLSKYEAEQCLLELAKQTGMEVVIIRPPLVYGPGVKANFLTMMQWINRGIPLPLGKIDNKRSLVALDNLVSFIIHCIEHPKAANEIFLISDGEDVSTTELLTKVAKAFHKKPMLIPVPVTLMQFAAKIVGKGDIADRLFGSLQIDNSKARELLDWNPVITMDEQLKKTVDAYLNETSI